MRCEKCSFYAECQRLEITTENCGDFEKSDEAIREEREAWEIDKADAKRKGEW